MLLLLLLFLQPAKPGPSVSAAATPCSGSLRVGFVTDITQLNSTIDAAGWSGATAAAGHHPCLKLELLRSTDPTGYQHNLEMLAVHDDLVVAGSFLLTEAVEAAASNHPSARFVLLDPLVLPPAQPNLAVISFREDQAAYLAGALAALTTRTGVVGGVYGLEGGAMTRYRRGFEQGARSVDPGVILLGAYQSAADGSPFGNPAWGEAQARTWLASGADVIFGAGGSTGEGALLAAAAGHRLCIGAGSDEFLSNPGARSCLLTSAVSHPELAVESVTEAALAGRWVAGVHSFGLREDAVGLAPFHQFDSVVTPEVRRRLAALAVELRAGRFLDGN